MVPSHLEEPMANDQFIVSDCLWLLTEPTGVASYDFGFRDFFPCRTPYEAPSGLPGVLRIGPVKDYAAIHALAQQDGIELIHTPAQHDLCSLLPHWYPALAGVTPRSRWFSGLPSLADIEAGFRLPVFIKGARQTSRHSASLSIVRSNEDFERVAARYAEDDILHWQEFVCREFVELRPVAEDKSFGDTISPSFEFRTFWWRGELVGAGRYWTDVPTYDWTSAERTAALAVARVAVDALRCGFLVVDVAQTLDGRWIVIEVNDGMESGYAGASPFAIWQEIIEMERRRGDESPEGG